MGESGGQDWKEGGREGGTDDSFHTSTMWMRDQPSTFFLHSPEFPLILVSIIPPAFLPPSLPPSLLTRSSTGSNAKPVPPVNISPVFAPVLWFWRPWGEGRREGGRAGCSCRGRG